MYEFKVGDKIARIDGRWMSNKIYSVITVEDDDCFIVSSERNNCGVNEIEKTLIYKKFMGKYEVFNDEKFMTVDYIKRKVESIRSIARDDKAAHSCEDDLYHSFIQWIADNSEVALAEKAIEVLKTREINFSRWYA